MANETPSTFRKNRHLLLALGLVGVMAGGVYFLTRGDIRMPESPLARVPRSASGIVYLRPAQVLASPWLHDVLESRGVNAALATIRDRCHLNPTQQVEDLTFFVDGPDPTALDHHLGLVAQGPFEHEKLGQCLEQAFEADQLGHMRRIEIDGVPAVQPEHGNTRAAFLGRKGIAIGTLEIVRQLIGTIRDQKASIAGDPTLARLWTRVAPRSDVVVVTHLPAAFRETLARTLGADRMAPILSLLGGLDAIGAGARVTSGIGLGTVLAFGSPASAATFTSAARTKIDELKESLLISLTPFGGIIRRIQFEQAATDVVMTLDVPEDNLERAIQFATGIMSRGSSPSVLGGIAGSAALPGSAQSQGADEVIRPTPAP